MNFGPRTNESNSFAIMDRALELGIEFFDTANVYGWRIGEGVTENIIGRWLAQGGGRRERIVLATKVYGKMGEGQNDCSGFQPIIFAAPVKKACAPADRSYRSYTRCTISTASTPWEEIWQAMESLVQQGKILYVGSSNFAGYRSAQAQCAAQKRHFMGLVCEQSLYNLNARMIELEVIPACETYGMGLIPWSPLAGGLLGGVLGEIATGRRSAEQIQERIEKQKPQLEQYEAFCKELGEAPADLALAWLLNNPVVTAPIIGPRTTEQLDGSLRALRDHPKYGDPFEIG